MECIAEGSVHKAQCVLGFLECMPIDQTKLPQLKISSNISTTRATLLYSVRLFEGRLRVCQSGQDQFVTRRQNLAGWRFTDGGIVFPPALSHVYRNKSPQLGRCMVRFRMKSKLSNSHGLELEHLECGCMKGGNYFPMIPYRC